MGKLIGRDGKVLTSADVAAIVGQGDSLAMELIVESMLSHDELESIDEVPDGYGGYSYILNDVHGRRITFDDVYCRVSEADGHIWVKPLEVFKNTWIRMAKDAV